MTRARHTVMLIILGTVTLTIVSFLKESKDKAANSAKFVAYQYRKDTNTEQRHNQELNKKQDGGSTRTDTWRSVSERHRIFVYSAFLDYRFSAVYFLCYLCPGTEIPSSISIFETEQTKVTLAVYMVPQTEHYLNNFSICIAPLNRQYNDVPQLIEWLELNIMFGVTHFTFYNLSASHDVAKVLDYYERLGLAQVLTWNIDIVQDTLLFTDKELHYFGQLAAINDCLYRHKTLSKYIAVIDLDELIVPRDNQDFTWNDMFNRLPTASEYMFRMAMFRKEAGFPQTLTSHLRTLTMTHRDDVIYPEYHRSKVIVRTTDATVLGIHETWGIRHPGSRHIVNTSIGVLHHYRNTSINDFNTEIKVIQDTTMYKYKLIVNRYDKVMREPGI